MSNMTFDQKLYQYLSVRLQTLAANHILMHTTVPFITVEWSRAELRLNAPSAPALFLNVSNKNDSLPVIYIGALFKNPCWRDGAGCWYRQF